MSSDEFEFDDIDDADLRQLDALEARRPSAVTQPLSASNSFADESFAMDDEGLRILDRYEEAAIFGTTQPIISPSKTVQTTLFGDKIQTTQTRNHTQIHRTRSAPAPVSRKFGRPAPKIKQWDHTAFAQSGLRRSKTERGKSKKRNSNEDEMNDVEFGQFPAPFVPVGPPPPMKHSFDPEAVKSWLFPLNHPKRDYQYNIVKNALFENTIVSLPTGLGKTFIAGVVMLNYYRWFPEGKIVFVAPTKPLVAQQVAACHQTCGIPGSEAVQLTGENPPEKRRNMWIDNRVLYMTPQTLINDLNNENCDPHDIVLLVVDEAHHATGDYAYTLVVRFMMAKNPHFRILALTATPGRTPNDVQAVIDNLHISHIEIRDESSLDLKSYMHSKKEISHTVIMTDEVNSIKTAMIKNMEVYAKELRSTGIINSHQTLDQIHPYALIQRWSGLDKNLMWKVKKQKDDLTALCRAMSYLLEGTIKMCYTSLAWIRDMGTTADGKNKKIASEPAFINLMAEIQRQIDKGCAIHPKMDVLKRLIIDYFVQGSEDDGDSSKSRIMVFVTFREAVEEIVDFLNMEQPLIRAHKFIGQGTDKRGNKGLKQSDQLEVIRRFKDNEFNVLVATSIGEEGLDIGELDTVICYDSKKTPINMLQRIGRTGRKRDGTIHYLLSENREESNLYKAQTDYKEVQKSINRGENLELFADVKRLIPETIKPECVEKTMEILEYEPVIKRKRGKGKGKGEANEANEAKPAKKRKRNDDIARNIPASATTGFLTASKLVSKKGSKKVKLPKVAEKNFDSAGEDDEDDLDIESGIISAATHLRRVSTPASQSTHQSTPRKARSTSRKTNMLGTNGTQSLCDHPTDDQFDLRAVDDSDDLDIERGPIPSTSRIESNYTLSSSLVIPSSPARASPIKGIDIGLSNIIDLSSEESRDDDVIESSNVENCQSPRNPDHNMAYLLDDDDEPECLEIRSSPALERAPESAAGMQVDHEYNDDVPGCLDIRSSPIPKRRRKSSLEAEVDHQESDGGLLLDDDSIQIIEPLVQSTSHNVISREPIDLSSSPFIPVAKRPRTGMALPPMPFPQYNEPAIPTASYPVRKNGGKPKKSSIIIPEPSDDEDSETSRARRLRHRESDSPETHPFKDKSKKMKKAKRKAKRKAKAKITDNNVMFNIVAEHSGDEVSAGSSHSGDDVEDEEDRLFLNEIATQASPSYNQDYIYRQGLMTQAPTGGPKFTDRPNRHGRFGRGSMSNRKRPGVSSSPTRDTDEEPDEYVTGSFVVDDDAEISYDL